MGLAIERVEPRHVREAVVDLLWEHRHWPGESREDFARLWEWRYASLGVGDPAVWVARAPDGGGIIGHLALFPRRFRIGSATLRGGVPGDILVHRAWRREGVGGRLMERTREQAEVGALDLVLTVATPAAHRRLVEIGFRDLGAFHSHVDVRSVAPLLRRRLGSLAPMIGGVADRGWASARSLLRRRARRRWEDFRVEEIGRDGLSRLDTTHWRFAPDRLVCAEDGDYVARRFLDDPVNERGAFVLRDRRAGRVEGLVVLEYRQRNVTVCDCRVNVGRLSEADAIALVGSHLPRTTVLYSVPLRPAGGVARDLRRLGFLHRASTDPPTSLGISAFWNPDLPCATALARRDAWSLYSGVGDG